MKLNELTENEMKEFANEMGWEFADIDCVKRSCLIGAMLFPISDGIDSAGDKEPQIILNPIRDGNELVDIEFSINGSKFMKASHELETQYEEYYQC